MKVAILAGGTGGHIFPALAVAKALEKKGHSIIWIGALNGMETRIVPEKGLELETIHIQNLRGKGFLRHLFLPFRLMRAVLEARHVLKKHQAKLVLGFGGFVAGPGGLAAKSLGLPLIIQEQNAVEGMTNRYLARIARMILVGFPSSFDGYENKVVTGNPVRADLIPLAKHSFKPHFPLHILVIGGSLGAQVFNEILPQTFAKLPSSSRPLLWHQTGLKQFNETEERFKTMKVEAKVTAFIEDMNEAYAWADLVICRAGALTVAELAVIGKPAIFVPLPHAADDHQTKNAEQADQNGAGILIFQSDFTAENMANLLQDLIADPHKLTDMAAKMKALGRVDATEQVVAVCEKFI